MASRLCLSSPSPPLFLFLLLSALLLLRLPCMVKGDCWLIEGDKGYVWLAICSQNQPPYETIPQHINSTVSMNLSAGLCIPHRHFFKAVCLIEVGEVKCKAAKMVKLSGCANIQTREKMNTPAAFIWNIGLPGYFIRYTFTIYCHQLED